MVKNQYLSFQWTENQCLYQYNFSMNVKQNLSVKHKPWCFIRLSRHKVTANCYQISKHSLSIPVSIGKTVDPQVTYMFICGMSEHVTPYVAKRLCWCDQGSWDMKIILGYPDGPKVVTWFLQVMDIYGGKQRSVWTESKNIDSFQNKKVGSDFSCGVSRRNTALWHLDL